MTYYSVHGATERLANAIAQGVETAGVECVIRQIPRVSDNLSVQQDDLPNSGPPYVTLDDLVHCSGLAIGSPTRFGNMAAPVKYFLDSTTKAWLSGALIDKPACVFTSSSSMHGGQESTLLSMQIPLLHHGMVIVGVPYSEAALHNTRTGGTPYGPSHVALTEHSPLSAEEIKIAQTQGQRLAHIARALHS